jgi:hypothetical protein
MVTHARVLYQSSNGDRWRLVHEAETGRVFVRHEANLPSGGRVTDIDMRTFLSASHYGPEHHELLRLVGTLAESASEDLEDTMRRKRRSSKTKG